MYFFNNNYLVKICLELVQYFSQHLSIESWIRVIFSLF